MLDIIMLIVLVPTILIVFFCEYPSNWKDRKIIFGIRNREGFKNADASARIDGITKDCRKQALIIMICCLIAAGLIILIPDTVIRMCAWMALTYIVLVVMTIPLVRGNSEMKSLKSELGISSGKNITYTDLKGTGTVHALKLRNVIIPDMIAAVLFTAALLNDLGIVKLHGILSGQDDTPGSTLSGMAGSLLAAGLMIIPISITMDRIRNEVISADSDVNINYNRARKKIWADASVGFSWINTGFIAVSLILAFIFDSQFIFVCALALYMILIMAGLFILIRKSIELDRRYRKETSIDIDDDDNWILGSIYYNPDDSRLNVAKRVGFGGTVNAAHPVGKAVYIMTALIIIASFAIIGFVIVLSRTPMTVRIDGSDIVCHQITDEYRIAMDSIDSTEIHTGSKDLELKRIQGMDMEYLQKGSYVVNGTYGCTVFLNLDSDSYIVIRTDNAIYYLSGNSSEETEKIYEEISENV